jgi:hypothetical protein
MQVHMPMRQMTKQTHQSRQLISIQVCIYKNEQQQNQCIDALHPNDTPESTTTPPKQSTSGLRHFLAVRCGLAKDMLFGPSTYLDHDRYGDDACFIQRHKIADVVGVADGVGGWRNYGIDPSTFSRRLMMHCGRIVADGDFTASHPDRILVRAYNLMQREHREKR